MVKRKRVSFTTAEGKHVSFTAKVGRKKKQRIPRRMKRISFEADTDGKTRVTFLARRKPIAGDIIVRKGKKIELREVKSERKQRKQKLAPRSIRLKGVSRAMRKISRRAERRGKYDSKIINLYNRGYKGTEIARKLRLYPAQVYQRLKALGLH